MKIRHSVNLIDKISSDDKKRIKNYIYDYGIGKHNFIGLEEWLQNWSHSNQVLYKLLGNNLIYEFDYNYEKDQEDLRQEINNKLFKLTFKKSYHEFYVTVIVPLYNDEIIDWDTKMGFSRITDAVNFIENKVYSGFKVKLPGKKKTLQVTEGGKPMKALQKIIDYFEEDFDFEGFEEFRLAHSMIFNDKIVKGKMCLSIHPLDYMTMSDNGLNWSSCMSWTDNGCYHVGTVEMMNSNNVICCYLKDNTDYHFSKEEENVNDPLYIWNNKRWRVLAYALKDIIMIGKSYPYKNKDLNMAVLEKLRELAKENLNWTYDFGPEAYLDMQYINSSYSMNRAKDYLTFNPKKHNIIWDTKGMYNDMLNDHGTLYYCVRNKVNKNKIFSVSGKSPCLCCGVNIIYGTGYEDDYNERFYGVGNVVCDDCLTNIGNCDCCGSALLFSDPYYVDIRYSSNDDDIRYGKRCLKCMQNDVRICPDCGKPFVLGDYSSSGFSINWDNIDLQDEVYPGDDKYWVDMASKNGISMNNYIHKTFRCYECGQKNADKDLVSVDIIKCWIGHSPVEVKAFRDYQKSKKYIKDNLEKFNLENYTPHMELKMAYKAENCSW